MISIFRFTNSVTDEFNFWYEKIKFFLIFFFLFTLEISIFAHKIDVNGDT